MNYPQQGYGAQPQPQYGNPGPARANAGAAAFAGILGLLTAGALIWSVIEYVAQGIDTMPDQLWTSLIIRGVLAVLVLIIAGLTLARKVGAAWTLVILGLITAATVILEALVLEFPIGEWLESMFEFTDTMSISFVVAAGLGLLTAIIALFAGAMKSQPEYNDNF